MLVRSSSRSAVSVLGLSLAAAIAGHATPADACSCLGPHAIALSPPLEAVGVPRNAHVRGLVPVAPGSGRLLLRQRKGADVPTLDKRAHQGDVDLVELVPRAALAPSTSYEIVVRDDAAVAPNHVIGFFTTGTDSDTKPPALNAGVKARVEGGGGRGAPSMCQTNLPYVSVEAAGSDDRALPLLFGIWVAKKGQLALDDPPDAIGESSPRGLTLGKSSLCAMSDYAFPPGGGPLTIAVAAMDVAGNTSPPRRFDVVVPASRRR